eukprot:UN33266
MEYFPDTWAGVASHSGLPFEGYFNPTQTDGQFIHIHGDHDRTIPWEGGLDTKFKGWVYNSGPDAVKSVAEKQNCDTMSQPSELKTPYDTNNQYFIQCRTYQNCDKDVSYCTYSGDHVFPTFIAELVWWRWTHNNSHLQKYVGTTFNNSHRDADKFPDFWFYVIGVVLVVPAFMLGCGWCYHYNEYDSLPAEHVRMMEQYIENGPPLSGDDDSMEVEPSDDHTQTPINDNEY